MLELDAVGIRLLTTAAVVALFFTGLATMRRAPLSLAQFGWRSPENLRASGWLIPIGVAIGLVLAIALIDGTDASPTAIGLGALLAIAVGFAEETWYRGLVLQVLRPRGLTAAVFGSSLLFAAMHAAGLLGGAAPLATLLRLVFAMLFGIVAALVTLRTGSLWPGIAWHASHNTISFASRDEVTIAFIVGYGLVGLVLAGYAVALYRSWSRPAADRGAEKA